MIDSAQITTFREHGYRCFERGLFFAAREYLEQWCDVAPRQEPDRVGESLNALGSTYIELGLLSDATETFNRSLNWHRGDGERDRIRSLCNLSLCHYLLGSSSECIRFGEEAFAHLKGVGEQADIRLTAHVHTMLSLGYIAASKWQEALEASERVLQTFESLGDAHGIARALSNLGLIYVETGRFHAGERLLQESLQMMESAEEHSTTAYTYTELGRLHFKQGDVAGALRFGSKALRILWDNMGLMDKAEVARLCELFGSIARVTGDRKGAVTYLQRASTYYAQKDRWREWNDANEVLSEVIRGPNYEPTHKVAIDWEDKQLLRYFTTLLGLMDTLESLYPALRGKSELVTKYALLLGEACGVEGNSLERLAHAARLHDIGLTSLDVGDTSEVQPGADSPAHTLLGERMLRMFGVPEEVQQAVRHHHECWDGSGVPDALSGREIPLFSRIIAVVETYVGRVVLDSDSRTAHTRSLEYLESQSGMRFDPDVFAAFKKLHLE